MKIVFVASKVCGCNEYEAWNVVVCNFLRPSMLQLLYGIFFYYINTVIVINYSALFFTNACGKTQVPLCCWSFYSGEY